MHTRKAKSLSFCRSLSGRIDRRGRRAAKRIYLRLGRSDGHEPWSDTDQWIIQVCLRVCLRAFLPRLTGQAPSFEQPRTVCVQLNLLSWDVKRCAAESSMWFLIFLYAVIEHDALIPTFLFWLTENEPMVMYSPKTNAFFCSCWLWVAVAWHQKLMWLRNGAHITEEWRLNTNKQKKMQSKRKCRTPEQHFEPACALQSSLSLFFLCDRRWVTKHLYHPYLSYPPSPPPLKIIKHFNGAWPLFDSST